MQEGLESPPAELLDRIQDIPEKYDYSVVMGNTRRSDTIVGFVTGVIALWVLGLIILYKDVLIQFFTTTPSLGMIGTSIYYLIPSLGIIGLVLVFSSYLFPSDRACGGEPC